MSSPADEAQSVREEVLPEEMDELEGATPSGDGPVETDDEDLESLLRFVRDTRGFDFTGYKRSSVSRRVHRRMQELGYRSMVDYRDLLEADVDEFTALFNTILINLTGFFRDTAAWKHLQTQILPEIITRRGPDEPIRVWSAGCATGEEPYTLAMIFADALGVAEASRRVKIYATDIDMEALAQARAAVYSEKAMSEVPEAYRDQYFMPDPRDRGSVILPALRRTVVFGRLDLTRDPPISRVDLVACRNTLMYLNAETQSFVIPRLHYALREGGYLFLGRAEMVLRGGAGRFTPLSLKHRIFVSMPPATAVAPSPAFSIRRPFDLKPLDLSERLPADLGLLEPRGAVNTLAELLVDTRGTLLGANESAREVLRIGGDDVGRRLADLSLAHSPVDLIEPLEQVLSEGRSKDLGTIVYEDPTGDSLEFEVRVLPVLDETGHATGATVTFADARVTSRLREGYRKMHEELETAYEELQSTNEELVTSNEELQSSYEELETSNEELETTNEELRSSNEELEATNLDLKSTSDTVEQLNTTLVDANQELMRYSGLHRQVMDHFPAAIVVLDAHLLIEDWNRAATALWGLAESDVLGEPFFALRFGLPLEPLQEPVRATRGPGGEPAVLELRAVDSSGAAFTCRVQALPISGGRSETTAMLIMEAVPDEPR